MEIDVSLDAVHRSRSLLLGPSRNGASSKMAAAVWRRPKSIWEVTCQGWESPIVGKLLHASSGPEGESMSPRGRPVPAVRSCNFCGCCRERTMCSTMAMLRVVRAVLNED